MIIRGIETSGVEEFVRRAENEPFDDQPLRLRKAGRKVGRDEIMCPVCKGSNAAIDWGPHRLNPDYNIALYCCFNCYSELWVAAEKLGLTPDDVSSGNEGLFAKYKLRKGSLGVGRRLPSSDQFAGWAAKLLEGGEPLRWLTEDRGVSLDVTKRHQIGWNGKSWMFPIFEQPPAGSSLLEPVVSNALYYPAEGRRKMRCWGGIETSLYPGEPTTSSVLLVEGELDALAGLSRGLPAVSGTTGAGHWNPLWTPAFAGRHVVISYDCDERGRTGAKAVAAELAAVAKSVKVIDLDPNWDQPDGYDLTDWFRDGRSAAELRSLIKQS